MDRCKLWVTIKPNPDIDTKTLLPKHLHSNNQLFSVKSAFTNIGERLLTSEKSDDA